MLSRLMHGARLSLLIGSVVVSLSLAAGIVLGLAAGFFPGLAGIAVMRAMDVLLTLPSLLLAIVIVAILGPGLINAVLAVAIVVLPHYVRIVRAAVLAERTQGLCHRVAGRPAPGTLRLMFRTVLPNCLAPLIVQASLGFSTAILDAAALGFLGLGAQPPTAEWGTMLADAREFVLRAWWVVTFPGHRDPGDRAGVQPVGRRAARRARSPAQTLMALLEIENLTVEFPTTGGLLRAVDGVSLTVEKGEVLGIVGESGSGKSVAMLAVMGLVAYPGDRARPTRRLCRPRSPGAVARAQRREIPARTSR